MPVRGYASTTSVLPGGSFGLHLSASPAGPSRLQFQRVGFDLMPETVDITLPSLAEPAADAWLGFRWPAALSFRVPATWPSGLYTLRARGPGDAAFADALDFVVRTGAPGTLSRILLAVDFIRPQAYNSAGGRSLYALPTDPPRASKLSFDRPLADGGSFAGTGWQRLIDWLKTERFGVEYASTLDLHTIPSIVDSYDCLLTGFHVEYWSKEMRDAVERFIARGGNLVSLSGNTCYRQVRFEDGARTLVCFKNARADPQADLERTTVAFAQPPVHRPPDTMLGVGFTYGAWGGALRGYTLHFPSHWVFEGVLGAGVTSTDPFMHYETDATPFVMEAEGYPRVTGQDGAPLSTVVLGSAEMNDWIRPGQATMTLYTRHGSVFSAGTTEWLANLGNAVIGGITRNVLRRLARRTAFGWQAIGHANRITAMAAFENRLYASDSDNVLWSRHPVLADARWRRIGHANAIVAMAADRGMLFAVSSDNRLWWRPASDADVTWRQLDSLSSPGAPGGAPGGTRAMCASGGTLYAVTGDGRLMSRPASAVRQDWRVAETGYSRIAAHTGISALTAYRGVLIAATGTNRLLRTSFDFVEESLHWIDIHHCNGARGLAVVDHMLFVATGENRLWWLDLRHRELDAESSETP